MSDNIKKLTQLQLLVGIHLENLKTIKSLKEKGREKVLPPRTNKEANIQFMRANIDGLKDLAKQSEYELKYVLDDFALDSVDYFSDNA